MTRHTRSSGLFLLNSKKICIIFFLSIHLVFGNAPVNAYFVDGSCESMQSMLTYSTPIKIGDSGSYAGAVRVFLTQHHLLTEKEADTDDYSTGKYKRDYYGKNTKKTILRFQKSEGIEQTGIVGRKTKEKIIEISCHK